MRKRPHILFVDDHEDTRTLLSYLLDANGYDLSSASSMTEGLRLARTEEFDLFLFDYKLRDGTGRELCEKIREFDARTPILFFSGSHPNVQQEALACGAQGFVLKPDLDSLRREIRQALRAA